MVFLDRKDAGIRLAAAVARLGLEHPVVLGIPRGGVPVAAEIARTLGAGLGIAVARKIPAPGRPELAIGATTASGETFIDRRLASITGADEDYIARATAAEVAEARRREAIFGVRNPAVAGKDVVLADDGLATGATAFAAIRALRAAGAARIILAVPVSSPRTTERIAAEVDDVVCLVSDPDFVAVGAYYENFDQLTDDDVKAALEAQAPSATS
ncbi:MAG TPA: phosphoribosyltransferase family protein [Planctomycetota bacterium]|nr:phosphoribosyltransferase family protein [Planctomycetota bacterium]